MAEVKLETRLNNNLAAKYPQNPLSTAYVQKMENYGLMEDIQLTNRYVSLGSNPQFGSSLSYRLSKGEHFLYNMAVVFTITYPGGGTTNTRSDYLAYKLIKNVRIQLGALQEWNISGESLLHLALEQCPNEEKKIKLLEAAGTVADTIPISSVFRYVAHIPIFGSSLKKRTYKSVKPLPLHMVKADNLEITVDLSDGDNVYSTLPLPTISKAELYYESGKVLNQDQLMKSIYKYPFTYSDSFKKVIGDGVNMVVDITGFRRAECVSIIWYVVNDADIGAKRTYEGSRDVRNIEWIFSGTTIRQEDGHDSLFIDLYDSDGSKEHGYRKIHFPSTAVLPEHRGGPLAKTGAPVVNSFIQNVAGFGLKYYRVLKLADILKQSQENGVNNYANGVDFSKQSLQLRFDRAAGGGASTTLYYTICYNAIIQFDENGLVMGM